jgi:hypothetical protein
MQHAWWMNKVVATGPAKPPVSHKAPSWWELAMRTSYCGWMRNVHGGMARSIPWPANPITNKPLLHSTIINWRKQCEPDCEWCDVQMHGGGARSLQPAVRTHLLQPHSTNQIGSSLRTLSDKPCIILGWQRPLLQALVFTQTWRTHHSSKLEVDLRNSM